MPARTKKRVSIILQESIRKCGKFGEIKAVKRGYAQYLERRGAAVLATKTKVEEVKSMMTTLEANNQRRQQEAEKQAGQLEKLYLYFVRTAGGQGKLYGSVSIGDLADEVKKSTGIDLEKNAVSMEPVRTTGKYCVQVHLSDQVEASLRFEVVESEEAQKKSEKAKENKEEECGSKI